MFSRPRRCDNLKAVPALTLIFAFLAFAAMTGSAFGQQLKTREDRPAPPAILSIIPSQAEPGMNVTLYGSGFTDTTRAFMGNTEAATSVDGPKQLSFEIPDMAPGLYGLYLRRDDGAISKVYRFSVTPRTPSVTSVSPDRVYACNDTGAREVHISGENFLAGSQVLFDGAVIKSRFSSSESLHIVVPQVAGGLHTIQVKNPGGTLSSSIGIFIDSKPEITGISQGEYYVNYYNLIIDGRNFQGNSTVVVEGKSMTPSSVNWADRENVVYVDCNRIIYRRHPYSSDVKNFTVQVINPNGETSSVMQVSAP
ncbi:transcription factor [bacterium]|nr:transcription factor [bacterium]